LFDVLSHHSGYTYTMSVMKDYRVYEIEKHNSYIVLKLLPQTDHDQLSFLPGQYATIAYGTGARLSPMRCFSMTNSPHSSQLEFAMRSEGPFRRHISKLQPGTRVKVQGPFGQFVPEPNGYSRVFLAGGIGITPFMSILRHATESGDATPTTLVFASRNNQDIPFRDELLNLQRQNPHLQIVFVVSEGKNDPASNTLVGKINERLLRKVTGDNIVDYDFYLCGPPEFTRSMQNILFASGADEEQIITESFSQSSKFSWNPLQMSATSLTYALTGLVLLAGVGSVMVLDLIRYVPKVTAASKSAAPASSSTTNQPSTSTTSSSGSGTTTDNSSSNSTTTDTSSSTASTSTTPSDTQYYQQPVSNVS